MVEANADPEVVTARILRETREAAEARALERAAADDEASVAAPARALEVAVPAPESAARPDPADSARAAKLGVMAALALVLVLIWIRQCRRT